jgi:cysteine synthase A
MMPDEGYRYQDTVYDDDWLAERGHLNEALPAGPVMIDDPGQPAGSWMVFDWARRSYDEVMSPSRPSAVTADGGSR